MIDIRKTRGIRKHLKPICERCEWVPEHRVQLQIHHRDRNRKNNSETNLSTLCGNCHIFVTRFPDLHPDWHDGEALNWGYFKGRPPIYKIVEW